MYVRLSVRARVCVYARACGRRNVEMYSIIQSTARSRLHPVTHSTS